MHVRVCLRACDLSHELLPSLACPSLLVQVCMQGGIHPDFTGTTYLDILRAAKAGAPGIHVHAFSPLEVYHVSSVEVWWRCTAQVIPSGGQQWHGAVAGCHLEGSSSMVLQPSPRYDLLICS